jgi:O-methyltransferase involved in polyketide biosynthesis
MPDNVQHALSGVPETLLITLYVRARESQRPDAMMRDARAVEMVGRIEADFSRLELRRHDEVAIIMRMKKFDEHVRRFLGQHPDGVVLHIGCGLDTRFDRVDNGQVEWFDLDVPEVIALRQQLVTIESGRYHLLAASVFDDDWIEAVGRYRPRPVMFVAEGVLPYFEEAQVRSLVLRLRDHFPGSELVCDAQKPFMVRLENLHLILARVAARLHWSLRDGKDVEQWGGDIRLLDEWNFGSDEMAELKGFRWVRWVRPLARASGIFHYRLGR